MYAHEFPEEAGSMNTKESIHIRTDECNKKEEQAKEEQANEEPEKATAGTSG